ncbi:MAG TPA: PspC domain-containing protein [Streptosporangiaceae bacterium]|nr:PspC domain-containing protein [Streptosporangiaceae bacterium]
MNTSASEPESNSNDTTSDTGIGTEPGPAPADAGPAGGPFDGATRGAGSYSNSRSSGQYQAFGYRELYRPIDDRMLAGVASGIARYLGVDAIVVRIVLAVLAFVGGAGIPIYLAGWLLIPEEGADASIASDLLSSLENRSR